MSNWLRDMFQAYDVDNYLDKTIPSIIVLQWSKQNLQPTLQGQKKQ
jgi:hypothetical protein